MLFTNIETIETDQETTEGITEIRLKTNSKKTVVLGFTEEEYTIYQSSTDADNEDEYPEYDAEENGDLEFHFTQILN